MNGAASLSSEGVRLARSATYLVIPGIVIGLSGILYFAFASRILPTIADLGKVSAITMFSGLLSAVFLISLPQAITRFYAKNIGMADQKNALAVALTGRKVGIALSTLSGVLCFLFAPQLSYVFLGSESDAIFFMLLAVDSFAIILTPFLDATLEGAQQFKKISMLSVSSSVIRCFGAIAFLLIGYGIAGIIVAWIIGDFIHLFLSAFCFHGIAKGARGGYPLAPMVRYSAPVYGSGILNYLQSTIDRYVVLGLVGAQVLGMYTPASTAVLFVSYISGAVSSALFPKSTELYGKGDHCRFDRIMRVASRYVSLIYVPLTFGLAATALPVLQLFAGNRYSEAASALAILAIASTTLCHQNIVGTYFSASGKTIVFFISQIIALTAGSIATAFLVAPLGSTGAAIGKAAMSLAYLFVLFYYARGCLKRIIDWKAFSMASVSSAIMVIGVIVVELFVYSKYLLPIYIIAGALIYLAMLKLLKVLNEDDVRLLEGFLPNKLRRIGTLLGQFLVSKKHDR